MQQVQGRVGVVGTYLAGVDEEEADGDHPERVEGLGQARDERAELGPERTGVGGGRVDEDDALPVGLFGWVRCWL